MPARLRNFIALVVLVVAVFVVIGLASSFNETIEEATAAIVPKLIINEVMTSNKTALPDPGGQFSDYIELYNNSDEAISLGGLSLSDDYMQPSKYAFPDRELGPREFLLIYCVGKDRAGESEYYAPFRLSAAGEDVGIYDTSGLAVYEVSVPTMSANQAYLRGADDTWVVSREYSPGFDNTAQGHEAFLATRVIEKKPIVINEVMSSNDFTWPDARGSYNDWIELRNVTEQAVDISGWGLTDNPGNAQKYVFPDDTVLQGGEYMLVYCVSAAKMPEETGDALYAPFGLSSKGEEIALFDPSARLVDSITLPALETDTSYGRNYADMEQWEVFEKPTPGLPNNDEGVSQMNSLLLSSSYGIYITELMAQPRASHEDTSAKPDWVELHNASGETVSLLDWGITDNKTMRRYVFPDFSIGPGEYKVVNLNGDYSDKTDEDGNPQVNFGLSADETLMLTDAEGKLVQRIQIPWTPGGVSYGRGPGQEGFFYYENPTPGQANGSDGKRGVAAMPSFNVPGGVQSTEISVTINVPEGCTVYYTTDASEPTQSDNVYSNSISLSSNTVLRARAYKDGYIGSTIETQTYIFGAEHTLPVVSLVTDPDNLYSEEKGIMVKGPNAFEESPYGRRGEGANFWMAWEHKAHVEFYYDDEQVVSMNIGLKLNGQYSRSEPQKAFGLYARECYEEGMDMINYPLFSDLPYDSYSAVVLRASGQDYSFSRIRDMVQTSLAEGTNILYQRAQPVVLYLNGEFFAHYNLRERINIDFIRQHEGLENSTKVDIIKGGRIQKGSRTEYRELTEYVAEHGLSDPDDLQYLLNNIDVDNFFNYHIIEVYTGNADNGNIRYYRPRIPGAKWRWILFDMDWGMWLSGSGGSDSLTRNGFSWLLHPDGTGQGKAFENVFIRALMEVPEYRDKFLMMCGDALRGNMSTKSVIATIDKYEAMIEPEMETHFAAWNETADGADKAYKNWKSQVEKLRRFARQRPQYMMDQAQEYFDLSDSEMEKFFYDVEVVEDAS